MRILWHSATTDTGYGTQTKLIVPRLIRAGHQVAISSTGGIVSKPNQWEGVPIFPMTPYENFGQDVVYGHYQMWKADLCVTFMCTWTLSPVPWRDMRVVHLCPVDTSDRMGRADWNEILATGAVPAAVSRNGLKLMRQGLDGMTLDPLYLPHGVDTTVFAPHPDRDELRRAVGLDGKFVIGLNAMNNDRLKNRKAIPEQLRAFKLFHAKHPDSVLTYWGAPHLPDGHRIKDIIEHHGLTGSVLVFDDEQKYRWLCGMIPGEELALWYNSLDVLTAVSKGEGFCLPLIEAQACGTPVVTMSWATGPELCGAGWKAKGQLEYNDTHQADWHVPYVESIAACYEKAYAGAAGLRGKARAFALKYDIDKIVREHWEPALRGLQ